MGNLGLDGVLALGKVNVLLLLALSNKAGLVLSQTAADGTGLLGAHIKGLVLLPGVLLGNLLALLLGHNGQNTGDGLADMAAKEWLG